MRHSASTIEEAWLWLNITRDYGLRGKEAAGLVSPALLACTKSL